MRALVTNDDGIDSPGLLALARAARDAGLEVTVAAPSWDSSGASASLTGVERDGRLLFEKRSRDQWTGMDAFAVEAAPALIVWAAVHGAFGDPPDLVVSGINNGANAGHAVLHSGTVGAALTASTFERPAVAFSMAAAKPRHLDTAAGLASSVLAWMQDASRPIVLNVNVPDVPTDQLRGLVPTRLASYGAVQTNITESGAGYVQFEFNEPDADHETGTDTAALAEGYACFTALSAVCEHEGADTTGLELIAIAERA